MKTTRYQHKGRKAQKRGFKPDYTHFVKWLLITAGLLFLIAKLIF